MLGLRRAAKCVAGMESRAATVCRKGLGKYRCHMGIGQHYGGLQNQGDKV